MSLEWDNDRTEPEVLTRRIMNLDKNFVADDTVNLTLNGATKNYTVPTGKTARLEVKLIIEG